MLQLLSPGNVYPMIGSLFSFFFKNKHRGKHFLQRLYVCLLVRNYISADVGPDCTSLALSSLLLYLSVFRPGLSLEGLFGREGGLGVAGSPLRLCRQAGSFLFVFLSGQGHLHIIMSIGARGFIGWGWAQVPFSW